MQLFPCTLHLVCLLIVKAKVTILHVYKSAVHLHCTWPNELTIGIIGAGSFH